MTRTGEQEVRNHLDLTVPLRACHAGWGKRSAVRMTAGDGRGEASCVASRDKETPGVLPTLDADKTRKGARPEGYEQGLYWDMMKGWRKRWKRVMKGSQSAELVVGLEAQGTARTQGGPSEVATHEVRVDRAGQRAHRHWADWQSRVHSTARRKELERDSAGDTFFAVWLEWSHVAVRSKDNACLRLR
ncbi:hypothetical protein BGY98DRAFT_937832 [Russula aff. rugulosa BPL654]|nr:hypothetical protein BGY98DRAFT_937832 [Russula aff. rugulosa BPL654]